MRKHLWTAVLAAVLVTAITSTALAAGKRRTFGGKVKSVDAAAGTMVLTDSKTGEDITVSLPAEKVIFVRRDGTEEDVKEGRGVEAYGTVAEDKKSVYTRVLTVYTGRDRGGNSLKSAKRADGKLARDGDDWYVDTKEGRAKIVLAEPSKLRRVTLEPATVADIKPGGSVYAYGAVADGKATSLSILSINE